MDAEVAESFQASINGDIILDLLRRHSHYLLKLLGREFSGLHLVTGKISDCARNMLKLCLELGVQSLDTVLHRLIKLLESFIDLFAIIRGNLFALPDQLVQMFDTIM